MTNQQTYNNRGSDPVDGNNVAETMESIRDKIGDLMDLIGEIGEASDPNATGLSQTLGKIQTALGDAHGLILGITPPSQPEQIMY